MANTKSAKKRARQTIKRTLRNRMIKSALKTLEKKLIQAAADKSDQVQALLSLFTKKLYQARAKGVLKRNTASRQLSRTTQKVNQLLQASN